MKTVDLSEDAAHRELAEDVLRTTLDAYDIAVESIDYETEEREGDSWLCYIVDPRSADRRAETTARSARDHVRHYDPNGLRRHRNAHLAVSIVELEIADEASMTLYNDDDQPVLVSPWMFNQAVARLSFRYTVEGHTLAD